MRDNVNRIEEEDSFESGNDYSRLTAKLYVLHKKYKTAYLDGDTDRMKALRNQIDRIEQKLKKIDGIYRTTTERFE